MYIATAKTYKATTKHFLKESILNIKKEIKSSKILK